VTRARRGIDELDQDFRKQAEFLRDKNAGYVRILETVESWLVSSDPAWRAVLDRIAAAWSEREFFAWYDRPLLLIASLRAEALRQGSAHPLHAALVEGVESAEAVTAPALLSALAAERARTWEDLRTRYVQTNDTTRGVAWLWPAHLAGCDGGRRPLVLVDIGASAGLNLVADRLPRIWADREGLPLRVVESPRTLERVGIDARPIDARDPEQATWLRACIWPRDRERLLRLDAGLRALTAMHSEGGGPELIEMDATAAPEFLHRIAAKAPDDALLLVYQSVFRDYMPPPALARYERGMKDFLGGEPYGRVAWVELETGPDVSGSVAGAAPGAGGPTGALPAALYAHARARDGQVRTWVLARCQYHPAAVHSDDGAVAEFVGAVTGR
jgi:hypothetical protein